MFLYSDEMMNSHPVCIVYGTILFSQRVEVVRKFLFFCNKSNYCRKNISISKTFKMPMIFNFSFNNINLTIQDPQVVVLSHLVIILHNFNSDFFCIL